MAASRSARPTTFVTASVPMGCTAQRAAAKNAGPARWKRVHASRRFPEAAEALRYARDIDPRVLETYRYLGLVYTTAGQPERAAIAQLQQGLLDGFQPGTLAEVRAAYAGLPDGACATQDRAGVLSLNLDCPRLHTGLCRASADLAQSFIEARLPARAQELRETAVERYGCPAARTQQ